MPETAANCNDPSDSDRLEEELDVQYQAAIQSLLNRATELTDEAVEACAAGGAEIDGGNAESLSETDQGVRGADQKAETPGDPTDFEPEGASPMRGLPTPRSRPSETSDQLRDLRRIAKASAHAAITTHAARRRKQIMLPVYVAIPLGVCGLILSPWIFEGDGVALVVAGISIAVSVVAVRGFVALRQLDAASSSTQEPGESATDASAVENVEPIREDT